MGTNFIGICIHIKQFSNQKLQKSVSAKCRNVSKSVKECHVLCMWEVHGVHLQISYRSRHTFPLDDTKNITVDWLYIYNHSDKYIWGTQRCCGKCLMNRRCEVRHQKEELGNSWPNLRWIFLLIKTKDGLRYVIVNYFWGDNSWCHLIVGLL